MVEETMKQEDKKKKVTSESAAVVKKEDPFKKEGKSPFAKKGKKGNERFSKTRYGRSQNRNEVDRQLLSVRRVARVVAGGRRFSLSVAVGVGDRQGRVGIGTGKGPDMATAMEKATNKARKNMITIPLTKNGSIPHETQAKYCSSMIALRPAEGFVAGGAVRIISELAGIKKISAKILSRSKSQLNNARATLKALSQCK